MQIRDRIKELRRVPASSLTPNPKNWRTHPAAQQEAMRAVLSEIGYADALLARETASGGLMLIDGHLRSETTPDSLVPVLVLDVTESEADKILATLDPLAAMAGVDGSKLEELLDGIETDSVALQKMLDDLARSAGVGQGQVADDDVPPVPGDAASRLGDLYILGDHRLLCGDATSAADVARLLGPEIPRLMITDPPYGVEYDPVWRNNRDNMNHPRDSHRTLRVNADDRADWVDAWKLFPGDVAYVWCSSLNSSTVQSSLVAAGLFARAMIVWVKPQQIISRGHYHWRHESAFVVSSDNATDPLAHLEIAPDPSLIDPALAETDRTCEESWYAVRNGATANWTGGRRQTTVWEIGFTGETVTRHGTQKPVECMARPMRNHGTKGDAVYDPFLGSGTSLIAAEKLGRRCFGLEIDPLYCDVIVARWERLTGRKAELQR